MGCNYTYPIIFKFSQCFENDSTFFKEREFENVELCNGECCEWDLVGEEEDISRRQSCVRGSLIRWRYNPKDEHLERSWRGVERGMVFLASAISLIPLDTPRSILPVIATNPVHSI